MWSTISSRVVTSILDSTILPTAQSATSYSPPLGTRTGAERTPVSARSARASSPPPSTTDPPSPPSSPPPRASSSRLLLAPPPLRCPPPRRLNPHRSFHHVAVHVQPAQRGQHLVPAPHRAYADEERLLRVGRSDGRGGCDDVSKSSSLFSISSALSLSSSLFQRACLITLHKNVPLRYKYLKTDNKVSDAPYSAPCSPLPFSSCERPQLRSPTHPRMAARILCPPSCPTTLPT